MCRQVAKLFTTTVEAEESEGERQSNKNTEEVFSEVCVITRGTASHLPDQLICYVGGVLTFCCTVEAGCKAKGALRGRETAWFVGNFILQHQLTHKIAQKGKRLTVSRPTGT